MQMQDDYNRLYKTKIHIPWKTKTHSLVVSRAQSPADAQSILVLAIDLYVDAPFEDACVGAAVRGHVVRPAEGGRPILGLVVVAAAEVPDGDGNRVVEGFNPAAIAGRQTPAVRAVVATLEAEVGAVIGGSRRWCRLSALAHYGHDVLVLEDPPFRNVMVENALEPTLAGLGRLGAPGIALDHLGLGEPGGEADDQGGHGEAGDAGFEVFFLHLRHSSGSWSGAEGATGSLFF